MLTLHVPVRQPDLRSCACAQSPPPARQKQNLDRIRRDNPIGAKSETWLRDVAKVLNRRFDPVGRDRPLVVLAQRGCDMDVWRPILLWHVTRDEFLLRDFLLQWLYPRFDDGTFRVTAEELWPYLRAVGKHGGIVEHKWTDSASPPRRSWASSASARSAQVATPLPVRSSPKRRQSGPSKRGRR